MGRRRLTRAAAFAAAALAGVAALAPGSASAELPTARHVLLGRSVDGRAIRAVRIGDPASPRKAIVVGAIHGDEPAGLRVTRAIRSLAVTGVDVWVIDTVNPDGLARHVRQNARGVDLNRNFPFRWRRNGSPGYGYWTGRRPLSEPESRIVRRWILRIRPAVSIWYHQPWNAVLVPCRGHAPIERRYARRARARTSCRGDDLVGTAMTWENHVLPQGRAFVVELPGGYPPARLIRRHALAAVDAVVGR